MDKSSGKTILVNVFGTLGYLCCFILWGWTGVLYIPILLENERLEQLFLPPPPTEPVVAPQVPPMSSPIAMLLAVVITITILAITIAIILRAPKTIARTGQTVTTKAAHSALPLIVKGQKLSPAKKQRLTTGLIKLSKLLLATLPVAIGFLGVFVELPLPFAFAILVSSILAICALLWFSAQYIAARLLRVNLRLLI